MFLLFVLGMLDRGAGGSGGAEGAEGGRGGGGWVIDQCSKRPRNLSCDLRANESSHKNWIQCP